MGGFSFPGGGMGSGDGGGGGGGSSPFNASSILGGVGGIGEIIMSLLQNSQYSNTLGTLTNDLNSVLGPEVNMGTGFLSNFKNQVAPELQSIYGSQTALGQQSYGTAGQYAGGAAGAAGALQANPYIGGATPLIGGLEKLQELHATRGSRTYDRSRRGGSQRRENDGRPKRRRRESRAAR